MSSGLRIFLALASSPVPGFASDLWTRNLHDPLVDLGHEILLWDDDLGPIFELDPRAAATAAVRSRCSQRWVAAVERAHREAPLDLVLTYVSDSHLDPAAIDHVRDRVAPVVNFFCNNIHQFHLVRRVAPHFTVCLVPEREAVPSYRLVGANPVSFPMAANPAIYRPREVSQTLGATFAGQRYADRASGLLALREAEVDAHVFGLGWAGPAADGRRRTRGGLLGDLGRLTVAAARGRNPLRAIRDRRDWARLRRRHPQALHGPVADDEYIALFSRSRVSLGFLLLGDSHRTRRPLRQVRLREFEAPMSGAFYLTEFIEELAEHYEVGREIVCWRTHEELVDLTRYYLAHDSERERIRQAGLDRARRDHTWHRRFEDLFTILRKDDILRR
jgi:spore maturation protein CgeB